MPALESLPRCLAFSPAPTPQNPVAHTEIQTPLSCLASALESSPPRRLQFTPTPIHMESDSHGEESRLSRPIFPPCKTVEDVINPAIEDVINPVIDSLPPIPHTPSPHSHSAKNTPRSAPITHCVMIPELPTPCFTPASRPVPLGENLPYPYMTIEREVLQEMGTTENPTWCQKDFSRGMVHMLPNVSLTDTPRPKPRLPKYLVDPLNANFSDPLRTRKRKRDEQKTLSEYIEGVEQTME